MAQEDPTRRSLGRRLRSAARPSLGLALTGLGIVIGIGALLVGRDQAQRSDQAQVRVCRGETLRATVRRQARARETHQASRPISSHATVTATEATGDGGRVSVTATASGRRTLVVRAVVTAMGDGAVTLTARGRACAFDSDRKEAGFRAGLEAKRRAQAAAERRAGSEARSRARAQARSRGQADARRRAQAKLDRSEPGEQAELDETTREDARDKAREDAKQRAESGTT